MDESLTTGATYWDCSLIGVYRSRTHADGRRHRQRLCLAAGAGRRLSYLRVVNFQADGSALYSTPALWCQSREGLDVTTIICKNDAYRILDAERRWPRGLGAVALNQNASRTVGSFSTDWPRSRAVTASRAFP